MNKKYVWHVTCYRLKKEIKKLTRKEIEIEKINYFKIGEKHFFRSLEDVQSYIKKHIEKYNKHLPVDADIRYKDLYKILMIDTSICTEYKELFLTN